MASPSEPLAPGAAFRAADDVAERARFKAHTRKQQAAQAEREAREAEEQRTLMARMKAETRARHPEWYA